MLGRCESERAGKTFTGFDFGSWGRVYLKSHEIRKNLSKRYMVDAYGGYEGEVWRVEVEFSRAQLRQRGVLDLGAMLLDRLSEVVLRVPLAPGSRKRPDRRALDPVWKTAQQVARDGVVLPWAAPPALPGKWPHADAARRAQGEGCFLTGLNLLTNPEDIPAPGLTVDDLPALAARYARAVIERDPKRCVDLIRRIQDRRRLLGGGGVP